MRTRLLILVACLSLITAAAWAHGGEEHVVGTVTNVAADSITVKTVKSAVTVAVVPATKLSTNKVAAKIADVHVGDRVVIHAKEATEGKLVADTVEFSAPKSGASATPKTPVAAKKG